MISRIKLSFAVAALALSASVVSAAPVNLLSNGSFENDLAGWDRSGPSLGYETANYAAGSAYPSGSTAANLGEEAAGAKGLYFYEDSALARLTQRIYLQAGRYNIGFDAFAPAIGYVNPANAVLSAIVNGVTYASYSVASGPSAAWGNYSGLFDISADGYYDIGFQFEAAAGVGKDIVLDRTYLVALSTTNKVPEPGSLALMGLGLIGLVAMRKRQGEKVSLEK